MLALSPNLPLVLQFSYRNQNVGQAHRNGIKVLRFCEPEAAGLFRSSLGFSDAVIVDPLA